MGDEPLPKPESDHPTQDVVIILAVFFEFGLAPFSLIVGWLLGHRPLETFQWSVRAAGLGVLASLPLIVMFLAILKWPIGPLARVKQLCDNEVVPLLEESPWSDIALLSLTAGLGEEMLFRGVLQASLIGVLQPSLGGCWSVPWGVGMASIVFGICHPISVPYAVLATILGLYLGTVWFLAGNLLTVMITHALYDFVALAYLLHIRPRSGASSTST